MTRHPTRDLWIAALVGAWAGVLGFLLMLAFIDSIPRAGVLDACEGRAAECVAVAEGL